MLEEAKTLWIARERRKNAKQKAWSQASACRFLLLS
jgi:hypothetical protein